MILEAWSLMDRRIDWAALPMVVELFGITDVERFIAELTAVRTYRDAHLIEG